MELMVVIVIVAILAAVAVPLYINYVKDAQRTEAKGAIGAVITAEQTYFQKNQTYVDATFVPNPGQNDQSGLNCDLTEALRNWTITVTGSGVDGSHRCGNREEPGHDRLDGHLSVFAHTDHAAVQHFGKSPEAPLGDSQGDRIRGTAGVVATTTERGFSLVEVMVAGIVAIVAVMGLAFTFSTGRGMIDRYAAARDAPPRLNSGWTGCRSWDSRIRATRNWPPCPQASFMVRSRDRSTETPPEPRNGP